MTQPDRDLEDLLRRALHAAADPLEPSSDGLQRIRAGLRAPYAAPVAWMLAAYSAVARRVLGGLDSLWAWPPVPLRPAGQCRRVTQPSPPPRRHPRQVRLAVALVAAAFAVVLGVSAVTPSMRQAIAHTGSVIRTAGSRLPGSTGGLRVSGHGMIPLRGGGTTATSLQCAQNHTQPSGATCTPPAPNPAVSPANTAAASTPPLTWLWQAEQSRPPGPGLSLSLAPPLSPTPPVSTMVPASPSPTVSASPSPTVSASPSPTVSASPSASPSPPASTSPG